MEYEQFKVGIIGPRKKHIEPNRICDFLYCIQSEVNHLNRDHGSQLDREHGPGWRLLTALDSGVGLWSACIALRCGTPMELYLPWEGCADRWDLEEFRDHLHLSERAVSIQIMEQEKSGQPVKKYLRQAAWYRAYRSLVEDCDQLLVIRANRPQSRYVSSALRQACKLKKPIRECTVSD